MGVELIRTLSAPGADPPRQPLSGAAVLSGAAIAPGAARLPGTVIVDKRGSAGVLPHTRAVSPHDPASLLPVAGHGGAAVRFVQSVPTDLPQRPIRVYASLRSAPTVEARVDLVMLELERQHAFRRANIFVGVATGGGHVNPVALELVERFSGGDVASVSMQYGTRPSILSIDKVDDARDLTRALLARIRDRVRREHPGGGGPRVLLYGESLGGWASQSALDGAAKQARQETGAPVDPLQALGVDRAAWIGIPGFSRFGADRMGPGGMQALNGVHELSKLTPQQRSQARAWTLSHLDDPVHRADWKTIWSRPSWLPRGGPNPDRVDPNETWKPLLTFLGVAGMALKSANKEVPGEFTDHGHDYRKELPELLRTAFGFDGVSDAELARITEQVRQSELWILKHRWK